MLLPVELPPGMMQNGTAYEAKGRWRSGNLVRWYNRRLRPVGGWQRFTQSPLSGIPRAVLTWRDLTQIPRAAIGTESHLYVHDGSQAYDISPVGLAMGNANGNFGAGYGAGVYQSGIGYGQPASSTSLVADATVWDLDTFGQDLIGLSPADGHIYIWTPPNYGNPAVVIGALGQPATPTITTSTTGGTLGPNSYYYVVTALGTTGETMGSVEVHITTTGSTSSNQLQWLWTPGAASYRVYRGTTTGGENVYFSVPATAMNNTITFTDTGGTTTAGTPPTKDTSTNAPTHCLGAFVTEERFVVAGGANSDPRNITWCSQADVTQWTATLTNTAGSLQLETNGRYMNAAKLPGQYLIFTDSDVHLMSYVGTPYIYGIERLAEGCGIVSRHAHAETTNFCVWMSYNEFYIYNGMVNPLPCEVAEAVFGNINTLQQSKIVCGINSEFNEIWWFYPSANSLENDSYVVWNFVDNFWFTGNMNVVSWTDRDVWPYPISGHADSNVYEMENGWTASGQTRVGSVFIQSGPYDLGNGDRFLDVKQLIPDTNNGGDASVNFTFITSNTPTGQQYTYGPYPFTRADGYVDVRFTGRQSILRIDSTDDGLFQFGVLRLEANPPTSGARR